MSHVYLDNAATTPVAPEVAEAMMEVYQTVFGNPSSTHAPGRKPKHWLKQVDDASPSCLGVPPRTICFTSGGTEADNHAIQAAVSSLGVRRIITSSAEHSAVIKASARLANLNIGEVGTSSICQTVTVDMADLAHILLILMSKTLVSLMHANNEVGVMVDSHQPVGCAGRTGPWIHSDTVQSMGHYPMDLNEMDVDFSDFAARTNFTDPKAPDFFTCIPTFGLMG